MAESLGAMKYSVGSVEQLRGNQQESLCSSTDERLVIEHYMYFELRGFRYDIIEYHEIYMNVRTLKTELDPGSWIVDVPFKTGFNSCLAC